VLNDHPDDIEDLVDAINEIDGHTASLGGCGSGSRSGSGSGSGSDNPPSSPPNSYVCYSKWEQDGGMVAPVAAIPALRGSRMQLPVLSLVETTLVRLTTSSATLRPDRSPPGCSWT
jgi:hypothetical protein